MRGNIKSALVKTMGRLPFGLWPAVTRGTFIPVFMLHRFEIPDLELPGHSTSQVKRFLEFLRRKKVDIISLEQAMNYISLGERLNRPAVAFTIDDGYQDHLDIGLPIFKQYDVPCTYFLPTEIIKQGSWIWDAKLQFLVDEAFENPQALSALAARFDLDAFAGKEAFCESLVCRIKLQQPEQVDQALNDIAEIAGVLVPTKPTEKYQTIDLSSVRTLENDGMLIGPHSRTHRILTSLDDQRAQDEIAGSWLDLQEMCDSPLSVFCYPVGKSTDYSAREASLVARSGMQAAVTAVPGSMLIDSNTNMYTLPRYALPAEYDDFIQYSTWIEEAKTVLRKQRFKAGQKA
ncbi:polysaccharide deacetylase family protein [Simiduia agarivorans]|uniref:NodB homology domain-containing protein n=1 Tax=Simiduia agarivorans (strain DSM 21679 / JCM 13881 / BCRC 17597 / SA1) TaxID=1117647 RepID=K4KYD2_SIMAS|nr:polysaccharide deacetylase family protein [Simiduia agarivorans]AFU98957.1 hypothetical protein M5M_08850 [Simiduia agarivorans SA1 = DSM 21679]